MSLTTKANVLIIAPELSEASNDLWNLMLADVSNFISSSTFGAKTEVAARNWVAHRVSLLSSDSSSYVSGPIVKEKVGDVVKEYAKVNKVFRSDADYGRTKYGRDFLTIRNSVIAYFKVVIPGV